MIKIFLIILIVSITNIAVADCDDFNDCHNNWTCAFQCLGHNLSITSPIIGIVPGSFKRLPDSIPGNDHVQFIIKGKWGNNCCRSNTVTLRGNGKNESTSGLLQNLYKVRGKVSAANENGNNKPIDYFKNPVLNGIDSRYNQSSTAYCIVGINNYNQDEFSLQGSYGNTQYDTCIGLTYYYPPPLCGAIGEENNLANYAVCDSTISQCNGFTLGTFSCPILTMYNTNDSTATLQSINYCNNQRYIQLNDGSIYFLTKPVNSSQICLAAYSPSNGRSGCVSTANNSNNLSTFQTYLSNNTNEIILQNSEYYILGCINPTPPPLPMVTLNNNSTNQNPQIDVSIIVDAGTSNEKTYTQTLDLINNSIMNVGPANGNQITFTANIYGGSYTYKNNIIYDEIANENGNIGRCVTYQGQEYYIDGLEYVKNSSSSLTYVQGGKKMCIEGYNDNTVILVNKVAFGDINGNMQYQNINGNATLVTGPGLLLQDVVNQKYDLSNILTPEQLAMLSVVSPNGNQRNLCANISVAPSYPPNTSSNNLKPCTKAGQPIYQK